MRLLPLSALVVMALTMVCHAQIWAWQNAEPLSPNAFVDAQGTLGASLFLRCDSTLGECKWRIRTRARIDDGTLNAYDVHLRDPAGAGTFLSISETSFAGSPWSNVYYVDENIFPYLSRLGASVPAGQPQVPGGPTIHFMHSYVLTSAAGVPPGTLTQLRAGSAGFSGLFPGGGGGFRPTSFGGNPAFAISGGAEWPNPVIHINYVPEPSTAALLLAAPALLMALTRRRPTGRQAHRRRR